AKVRVPFLCSPKYFIPNMAAQLCSGSNKARPKGWSSSFQSGSEKMYISPSFSNTLEFSYIFIYFSLIYWKFKSQLYNIFSWPSGIKRWAFTINPHVIQHKPGHDKAF